MPEIRERDPNDLIKSKSKRTHKSRKGIIAPRLGAAMQEKAREHKDKKEAANEYAVGITDEAAAEVAARAGNVPGDIAHTIRSLQPKTKDRVLNVPEPEQENPREPIVSDEVREQPQELTAEQAQEKAHAASPEEPPYPYDNYTNYPPEQYHPEQPPHTHPSDPPAPAEAEHRGGTTAAVNNDIKEKPKGNTAPKQRPELEPKTRSRAEQSALKTSRPTKQTQSAQQSATMKATEQGRKKFMREEQKKTVEKAKQAAKKAAESAKKAGKVIVRAAKSTLDLIVGMFGGIGLVAIVAIIVILAIILASPLGILFSNEPSPNAVPLSSAISQINMELNTKLLSLQSGDYDDIIVTGSPPSWTDVVAVFAAYTAGAENGVDVVSLTPDRVFRLKTVFWQMCYVTSSTEIITIPDSNPGDDIDNSRTESRLTISILGKSADEMRIAYGFTDFQNEALDLLLSPTVNLAQLISSVTIDDAAALELLESLPPDLSPERRAVVQQALSLVSKVNYFWGGKSLVLGWDSRWGQLTKVTAAGSPSSGTYRPFGLDCSGFVDWVFYNTSGGSYIIGQGGGVVSQHRNCTQISWGEAQPGDLVFYPDDSHIGIVGLRDVTGNLLIIHCASGRNNVVITDSSGFMTAGRPIYYNE